MNLKTKKDTKQFLSDVRYLSKLPASRFRKLQLNQFPFDAEMLNGSSLYRHSRHHYNLIGGKFNPRSSSMMRSLSSQDLFKNEIDYTPSMDEIIWFKDHSAEVADPSAHVQSLKYFNENSLYHEQNHRILWALLPPAPKDRNQLRRYLNFAESIVVTLDLALGDQLGLKTSLALERLGVLYRPSGTDGWNKKSKIIYKNYLLSLFATTYLALELVDNRDILKAVNYILPGQDLINKDAVHRGLELSQLFTLNTNPQWQDKYWKVAQKKLAGLQKHRNEQPFKIAEDPLDLGFEFAVVRSILGFFSL